MASFQDLQGDTWELRVTIGKARGLRDLFGIDVDRILDPKTGELERMISSGRDLVEWLVYLLEDQILARGLTEEKNGATVPSDAFFDRLDGETLDRAVVAFLEGIADSLPKLKRRAILALIQKLPATIEGATTELEEKIRTDPTEEKIREKIRALEL